MHCAGVSLPVDVIEVADVEAHDIELCDVGDSGVEAEMRPDDMAESCESLERKLKLRGCGGGWRLDLLDLLFAAKLLDGEAAVGFMAGVGTAI